MGRPVGLRALPPRSAVGAVAIILLLPRLDEMPGVCQGNENILVQAFIVRKEPAWQASLQPQAFQHPRTAGSDRAQGHPC